MTASHPFRTPARDGLGAVAAPVDALLTAFLHRRTRELAALDPALEPVGEEIARLVTAGGKRLRPAFVYWGHRATGAPHEPEVLKPAAAVELLHTFALIHDDIMDRSEQRRGGPATHIALAARHRDDGLAGDPAWFGVGGGILAGDLAFVWADQLLDETTLPAAALDRARRVFTDLRVEVMAGQYLDLRLAGRVDASKEDSLRVSLLKSGRYTVTRPLQLGAALGRPSAALDTALRSFGDAVGVAFQLRDDVLGLFGDRGATGKETLSDLREGKRTMLVLQARERCASGEREVLDAVVGDPGADETAADRVREIVVASGALAAVERQVEGYLDAAWKALSDVPQPAREALTELAMLAVDRAS